MILLYVGALAAEVAGLALAAHGFRRTWLEFRNPEDEFFAPIVKPVSTRVRVAYVHVRRLIGKPVPPKSVAISAATVAVAAGIAHATVTWGPLPPVNEDPAAFMESLNRRLADLNRRVQDAENRMRMDTEAAKARHAEATKAIAQVREEAQGQVRTITVGGLREQVAGWLLIIAGVLAAGIGDIISAA